MGQQNTIGDRHLKRAEWTASDWRAAYARCVALRLGLGHARPQAGRLAWNELMGFWHARHGQRAPSWACAGCGEPIGGAEALPLTTGERVHLDDGYRCLIAYGRRWRAAAAKALAALGLEPPRGEH